MPLKGNEIRPGPFTLLSQPGEHPKKELFAVVPAVDAEGNPTTVRQSMGIWTRAEALAEVERITAANGAAQADMDANLAYAQAILDQFPENEEPA